MNTSPPAVSVAKTKAAAVTDEIRQAEATLREANEELAEAVEGPVVTADTVQAALVRNLEVEEQLHDAVQELEAVTDLLQTAESEKAVLQKENTLLAGQRSGEGANSVLQHLSNARGKPSLGP